MNDLRKADLGTIKTFLVRNVTAEKLMSDLFTATTSPPSTTAAANGASISPSKTTTTPRSDSGAAVTIFVDEEDQ